MINADSVKRDGALSNGLWNGAKTECRYHMSQHVCTKGNDNRITWLVSPMPPRTQSKSAQKIGQHNDPCHFHGRDCIVQLNLGGGVKDTYLFKSPSCVHIVLICGKSACRLWFQRKFYNRVIGAHKKCNRQQAILWLGFVSLHYPPYPHFAAPLSCLCPHPVNFENKRKRISGNKPR